MKRALLLIFGVIILIFGIAGVLLGGATISIFGTKGTYTAPVAQGTSSGSALYVSGFNINANGLPASLLDVSVSGKSRNGQQIFLGTGLGSKVQEYLSGVPYDAVSTITDGKFVVSPVPGDKVPPPPASQSIWTKQDQGDNPKLSWNGGSGGTVFVAMNSSGAPDVQVDLTVTAASRKAFPAAVAAIIVGAIAMVLGVLMIIWGIQAKDASSAAETG